MRSSDELNIRCFSLAEIKRATNDFWSDNILGGRDEKVYYGYIDENGYTGVVAVKFYKRSEITFQKGIEVLASIHHDSIVSLVGYCEEEDEKILVYEFMSNGSLYNYLRFHIYKTVKLTVEKRLEICIGIAKALIYLHSDTRFNIVHGGVTTSNVLLDDNMVAKFSTPHMISKVYIIPDRWEPNHKLDSKDDVYAFGVILLGVLCQKETWNIQVTSALSYIMRGEFRRFLTEYVENTISLRCLRAWESIILACLENDRDKRPQLNQVMDELRLALELQKQQPPIEWNFLRFSFGDIEQATNEFSDQNFLGEGRLGKVYRGNICEKPYNRVVAVKRLNKDSEITFQKEVDLFSSFRHHHNIISLVGYCEEEDEKILVYEFMPNGSLFDYLYKNKDQTPRLTVEQRLEICIGVAKALAYLHSDSNNIIHGNVKAANILLSGDLVAIISNFGLSKTRANGPLTAPQIMGYLHGTSGYIASECYEPNYQLSQKMDVYAFGVVLLELFCERPAWKNLIILALPFILKGELPVFAPEHVKTKISPKCSRACANLVIDCLDDNPDKRPSINQVIDELQLALKLQQEPEQQIIENIWGSSPGNLSFEDIKTATKDFGMENSLGEGAFWKSYHGYITGKGVVFVRRINKEYEQRDSAFQQEVKVLRDCLHSKIIVILGHSSQQFERIIVYEFMPNGSLHNYLYNNQHDTPRLTAEQRLKICLGVAEGLSYLHYRDNIHHNLSTNNILLTCHLDPRISTVGFPMIGTEGYTAPECYEPNYKPDRRADVYAFGMLLLEVLCEKPPWKSLVMLALEFANKGELPMSQQIKISPECSQACEHLIRDCLDIDPHKRPSMNQVVDELQLALTLQENCRNSKFNSQQSSQLNNPSSSPATCQSFLLSDIAKATNDFSNYLGEGAFGKVYSGNISGHSYNGVVAVKRMSKEAKQGNLAFEKEIKLVSACNHVNIISLVGFCNDSDEKILLYKFMPNGSLYDYLYKNKDRVARLTVEQRLEICIGVAKGLDYLHSGTDYVIIHSDLKTDNILLDQNLVPKISDFGLSRTRVAGPSTSEQITNHVQGTTGYLAPECYEANYKLSRKADLYAYGVVLLEVLCERPAWDNLVILALPFIGRGQHPNFMPDYVTRHISRRCSRACAHLIMECLDTNPVKRPDMNQVVTKLEEALKLHQKYKKDHLLPFIDPKGFSSSSDHAVFYHNYRKRLYSDKDTTEEVKTLSILKILYWGYDKLVDVRNVLMDPLYKDQIKYIYESEKYSLPQLFVGGKHIGGYNMILRLHNSHQLAGMLEGLPDRDCKTCENKKCLPCPGGCYLLKRHTTHTCPDCCYWKSKLNKNPKT